MSNDITVRVGADITNFSKNLGKATRELGNLGGKLSSAGSSLTKSITTPALAAASALAGVTAVKGFGRLIGIDTARAKLKALGHDADSVETIMTSALDSVKGTSYGMDEAATTAANAVAAGVTVGKELTDYLTLTGDAAAIAGTSMSEMGSIINKVTTAGKAYNGELQMLSDRGLPIYQWLADEAGTTADAIFDMASQGEVSTEMFLKAIENNIGGAAKVMGEESFAAALKNIGSDIARIGANFLDAGGEAGGFFSTVKPMLKDFRGFLSSVEEGASELGKKFGDAFIGMIERIKEMKAWYDGLSPSMQDFYKNLALIGSIALISVGPALKILGGMLTFFGVTLPGVISTFKSLSGVFTALTGPVGLAIAAIGLLGGGLIYLYNTNETVREKLTSAWQFIKETAINVWQNIVDFMKPIISEVASFITETWERISSFWTENQELIRSTASIVWAGIKTVIENVMKFLEPFLKTTWENIKLAVQVVWEAIKAVVDVAITLVSGIIKTAMQIINGDWEGAWKTVESTAESVWESIKSFISSATTAIWENIKERFQDVVDSVSEKMDSALGVVEDIGNNIIGFFENIDLYESGKAIIQSAIDGIVAMKDSITRKVSEIAGAVRDFWPFSPAKRGPLSDIHRMDFAGPIAQSIKRAERPVEKAMAALAGTADSQISLSYATPDGIMSSLSGAVSGTVTVSSNEGETNSLLREMSHKLDRLGQTVIEMDGERVGRAVRPHVNEGNAIDSSVRRYFD